MLASPRGHRPVSSDVHPNCWPLRVGAPSPSPSPSPTHPHPRLHPQLTHSLPPPSPLIHHPGRRTPHPEPQTPHPFPWGRYILKLEVIICEVTVRVVPTRYMYTCVFVARCDLCESFTQHDCLKAYAKGICFLSYLGPPSAHAASVTVCRESLRQPTTSMGEW